MATQKPSVNMTCDHHNYILVFDKEHFKYLVDLYGHFYQKLERFTVFLILPPFKTLKRYISAGLEATGPFFIYSESARQAL
jgi:hypothetical protein